MVQPARLASHVRTLTEEFFPRNEAHPENLDRAAAWIGKTFESEGGRAEEQPFQIAGRIYRNVLAHFGPETRERIVVGAHYDAAGPLPGADDNASGVAGLLELAHLLGKTAPPAHVELVAFTLEEPPYFAGPMMGSAFHAKSLKKKGVKVRAMICLEMIGYFTDEPGSQQFPHPSLKLFYPSTGNFIAVVGRIGQGSLAGRIKKRMKRAAPLPVCSLNAPRWLPGIDFSDHRSYWEAGWDAVMITDTAFYRNYNYHSAADTADTLDYGRMAMVVQGLEAAVRAEAGRIAR